MVKSFLGARQIPLKAVQLALSLLEALLETVKIMTQGLLAGVTLVSPGKLGELLLELGSHPFKVLDIVILKPTFALVSDLDLQSCYRSCE